MANFVLGCAFYGSEDCQFPSLNACELRSVEEECAEVRGRHERESWVLECDVGSYSVVQMVQPRLGIVGLSRGHVGGRVMREALVVWGM